MRHQQLFPKLDAAGLRHHACRNSRKLGPVRLSAPEQQRHERGTRSNHLQSELPRQLVAQPGGPQFRNGESACSHHQRLGLKLALRRHYAKPVPVSYTHRCV